MTSSYPRARVENRLRLVAIHDAYRLIWRKHLSDPTGCRPKKTRFCDGTFAVVYAAASLETAFVEAIIRDRFVRTLQRTLESYEVTRRAWVSMSTLPGVSLNLIDLRDDGCVQLGAPTDACNARNPAAGQALAGSLYREHVDIDGIRYSSRLTGAENYAIFDRSRHKLAPVAAGELVNHPEILDLLIRHNIRLIDR